MILVTLGTQKQQFVRLLNYIENSNIDDKIIVQAGHTSYESKKMDIFDFNDYDEMNKLIDNADLVITHGGTGSIITPLKKGKKVIACARKAEYYEHIDNHQIEIVEIFSKQGYVIELKESDNIDEIIKKAKDFKPKKYRENTDVFIEALKKEISKYI